MRTVLGLAALACPLTAQIPPPCPCPLLNGQLLNNGQFGSSFSESVSAAQVLASPGGIGMRTGTVYPAGSLLVEYSRGVGLSPSSCLDQSSVGGPFRFTFLLGSFTGGLPVVQLPCINIFNQPATLPTFDALTALELGAGLPAPPLAALVDVTPTPFDLDTSSALLIPGSFLPFLVGRQVTHAYYSFEIDPAVETFPRPFSVSRVMLIFFSP